MSSPLSEKTTSTIEGFPGFTAAYGPTTAYRNPPAPFFWTRIGRGPYLSPVTHTRGWATSLDEARTEALT